MFGVSNQIWIGGSDIETEGTLKWERSEDSWLYSNTHTCPDKNREAKDCVKIAGNKAGRWRIEDCSVQIRRYLCQKQSPTSKLLWNSILGAEYTYVESRGCIASWDDAKTQCEDVGGKIGSVLSQEVKDAYIAMYSSDMGEPSHWIGLNDKESIQIHLLNNN